MTDTKPFSVGDVVRIRSWDDMEREYDLEPGGRSIACLYGFTPGMRESYADENLL